MVGGARPLKARKEVVVGGKEVGGGRGECGRRLRSHLEASFFLLIWNKWLLGEWGCGEARGHLISVEAHPKLIYSGEGIPFEKCDLRIS